MTPELVAHIARLAALELSAAEAESLRSDLGRILEAVVKLEAVTPAAPAHAPREDAFLRDDEPRPGLSAAEALANAPAAGPRGFSVPQVLP